MESLKRYPSGTLRRTVNGVDWWIPDDPRNVDRKEVDRLISTSVAKIDPVDADGQLVDVRS